VNERTLRVLEYDKIKNMLMENAESSLGKELCSNLKPSTSEYEVKDSLKETQEAIDIIMKWGSLPLEGIRDIGESLKRAEIGYVLTPGELLNICDLLRCIKHLKMFMKDGSKSEQFPIIYEIIDSMVYIKELQEVIENAIISEEEISDNASQKLHSIRKSIKEKTSKIKDKTQSTLQTYSKYLQDNIITIREGRYVIPVKAECKASVPGLVHDQSSSGSTLFIEPMALVDLNNEIKELLLKEKEEIDRILMEISLKVYDNMTVLELDNKNAAYLDFIMAKGKLAYSMEGTIPEVNNNGKIYLKGARHPLLDKKTAVPIDVKLGETYNAVVITGPNTGGKTVTLKTVGLLVIMASSGLAIPCKDGSEVSIFENVFADIGDEQSIEQSLSTFSSHMTNIVNILEKVNSKSLVLVDELGAGTDPIEGAALAMSILKTLYEKGAKIIATTHYSEIKVFAMKEEGFENASVEFDVETLRPTYRLLTGIPGKSNAFEISRRLGLSDEIINNAANMVSKDAAKFEDVIQNLQNKTVLVEKELEEAQKAKREAAELKKELSNKKYKLDTERDNIIRKAQEEARRTVKMAKKEADSIIKELNQMKFKASEEISIKDAEDKRKQLKEKLDSMEVKDVDTLEIKEGMERVENVKVGEEVFVSTLSQKATVLTEPDSKGEVLVQVGMMKVNVPLSKLLKQKNEKKKPKKSIAAKIMQQKAAEISSSIDVRGQTIDEALYNIDKYLDDASLAGIENVTIIHGKGTGALREGIQSNLKHNHYIKSIRMGDIGEGGSGVTIAQLKR
jgi:DNA mismatch repair protein MutS2